VSESLKLKMDHPLTAHDGRYGMGPLSGLAVSVSFIPLGDLDLMASVAVKLLPIGLE